METIPPDSITTWEVLAQAFSNKYFPPVKSQRLRTEIGTFRQLEDEQLCEAWERYKDLLRRCPQHGYLDWLQIQLFYNGLASLTKSILDATAGGSIFSKNAQEAYTILEDLATTSYNWPCERSSPIIPKATERYEMSHPLYKIISWKSLLRKEVG